MAQRVIVVGASRGREEIPACEIMQMIGRAGRVHGAEACVADVIVGESQRDVLDLLEDGSLVVESTLTDSETLAFHLLAEICEGVVKDVDSANAWYANSFGHHTGHSIDVGRLFAYLDSLGAVTWSVKYVTATPLGDIASDFYFHPADVRAWMDNFTRLFNMEVEDDDAAVAWALGNVPVSRVTGDFGKKWHVVTEYKDALPLHMEPREGSVICSVLWWAALTGAGVGPMKYQVHALRQDAGRICRALLKLDAMQKWDMGDFFGLLRVRLERGVPASLASLCKLKGMSKSLAVKFHDMGVTRPQDIPEAMAGLVGDEEMEQALRKVGYVFQR